MQLKHIKIYEELEQSNFFKSSEPPTQTIQKEDYVNSYRGKGKVIEVDGDFAKIQLVGSDGKIVKVPIFSLTKAEKPEYDPNYSIIKGELTDLSDTITSYVSYLEQDPTAIDLHNAEDILTNTLVDVMALQKQDPSVVRSAEFDLIYNSSVSLADMITDISPGRKDSIDAVLLKYEELGNKQ